MSNIHLWRYRENKRNYPGYHLTADQDGCKVLENELLKLENTSNTSSINIELSPVTQKILDVPNNKAGNPTVVSLKELHLKVDPSYSEGFFEFSESHPKCFLNLSKEQAGCILKGVKDIFSGEGDYCIGGDDDHVLWFWWYGV